jgi:hypothetical protein
LDSKASSAYFVLANSKTIQSKDNMLKPTGGKKVVSGRCQWLMPNSYAGGKDQKDRGLKTAQANSSETLSEKKSIKKKGWQSGSSGRAPA